MRDFIKSMLVSNEGSISSKRVCGVSGWLVVLIILIYCAIAEKEAPAMTDQVMWCAATLLGVDSVARIFKKDRDAKE